MIKKHTFLLSAVIGLSLATATVTAGASVTSVSSYSMPSDTPEPVSAQLVDKPSDTLAHRIELPPIPQSEIDAFFDQRKDGQALAVGMPRNLESAQGRIALSDLSWRFMADGSRVATLELHSPQAAALRAGLDVSQLPKGMELRFHSAGKNEDVRGPHDVASLRQRAGRNDAGLFWSPVMSGEALSIELHAQAGVQFGDRHIGIQRASHLFTSAESGFNTKDLGGIGNSGACNIDINCEDDETWRNLADSVAKYIFTLDSGQSSICTGTLIADAEQSGAPLFLTANHCLDSDSVAQSVHSYWFFEREECGGPDPDSVVDRDGGASLLSTGESTDYTLLELNETPPGGTVFAGWNLDTHEIGDQITGIHHPAGDLKMISHGAVDGYSNYAQLGHDPAATHIRTRWSEGTTEGGSSGSVLLTQDQEVIGTLHGGAAACANDNEGNDEPDWYGRFDYSHACAQDDLGGDASVDCPEDDDFDPPGREDNVVSLSSGDSVSGSVAFDGWSDYSIEVGSNATELRVTVSDLTEDADLYVLQGDLPETDSFDCQSIEAGTADEECIIDNPGSGTWYIGIFGFEASDYTVKASIDGDEGGGDGDADSDDDSSSSSGCTMGTDQLRDPTLGLLLLMGILALITRRRAGRLS